MAHCKVVSRHVRTAAITLAMPGVIGSAHAEYTLNMTQGVTPLSHEIYDLHMLIFEVCVAIAVVVFAPMFWSIFRHRKSRGAIPAQFQHNTRAEIVWTVVPVAILVAMAVPATRTLSNIEDVGDADITVKVTGYQWRWHYDYVDDGFAYFSVLPPDQVAAEDPDSGLDPASIEHYLRDVDEQLVLPINKKIRILTTASDVIHSWWVPEIGWKRDAIPGFINESWMTLQKTGTFRGQCAELCGKGHGYMPIVVKAVEEGEFLAWVNSRKNQQAAAAAETDTTFTREELIARGEKVYNSICFACHQANGQGLPPAFPPLAGSPVTIGPIEEHLKVLLNGRPGTAMVSFAGQLTDVEIASVITFERNSWGNETRLTDSVALLQPREVAAAKAMASQ